MINLSMNISRAARRGENTGTSATPNMMNPPGLTSGGTDTIFVSLAAAPPVGGSPITRFDLRYSTDGSSWIDVIGITNPETLGGLVAGTGYFVQTRAVNANGVGTWSLSATETTDAATTAPDQMAQPVLSADPQSPTDSIVVNLAAAPGDGGSAITRFDLRFSVDGSNWTELADVADPETLGGLASDTTYFVQSRAANAIGPGAWSTSAMQATEAVTTVPDQMALPTLSTDPQSATDTIVVDLAPASEDGGSPILRFDLRYSTDGAIWTELTGVSDPETLGGLASGTTYFVQTRAVNANGAGLWSPSAAASTDVATTVPDQMAQPSLSSDPQSGSDSIVVDLAAAPGDGGSPITRFDLRYSTDDATWTELGSVANPETLGGLSSGTTYFVQTRAVNANGPGPWSTSATAATDAATAVPGQMAQPVLTGPAPIEHRTIDILRAAPPSDGGSPILSYDLRYSTDQVAWTTVTGISGAEQLTWLQPGSTYFVETRAVNGLGAGPWSPSANLDTAYLPQPIDYAAEPFVLQPPVDFGDGDPNADNLTRAETDVYESQGVFERFTDGRVRCIVDGDDPGTSPGTDPRCEHRGLAERPAETTVSFRVRAQIVSVEDGGVPVSGPSTRITLFQAYNVGIGNPDITIDGYVDPAGSPFILRVGWRPTQSDGIVTHLIDTGDVVAAGGLHPVADFRVDRYPNRFEVFVGANVLGSVPDFTSGDSGTPSFSRSVSDGDFYIKFGSYVHLDAVDPMTTRAVVDVFSETSDTAVVAAPPQLAGTIGDQSYLRRVAVTDLDVSSAFSGSGLSFALAPSSDPLPTGLVLGSGGMLTGTPVEATEIGQPAQIVVRASNTAGFVDAGFFIGVAGPVLEDLVASGSQITFTTDTGDGTFYLWFGATANPSDAEIETGTGPDHLADASFPVTGSGGQLLNFDLSAFAGQTGYLLVMHVAASGASSVPIFEQLTVAAGGALPAAFVTSDWTLADADIGQTATLQILSLPSNGGVPISDLEYRLDAGAWTSLGANAVGSYAIGGLTNGVPVDVEIRALNGSGGGPASDVKSVTPTAGVPGAFVAGDWSLATGTGSAELSVTLSALPVANGNAISGVEYDVDGNGTWIPLPGFSGAGNYALSMAAPGVSYAIRLRALNGEGAGPQGNSEIAVSSASATASYLASGQWTNQFVASDDQTVGAGVLTGLPAGTRLAVCIAISGGQGGDPSEAGGSVTVGGVPATLRRAAPSGGGSAADASFTIWEVDAPSGFSSDRVAVNAIRSMDEWSVDIFEVTGLSVQAGLGDNITGDASSETPVSLVTTPQAGDQMIGGIVCRNNETGNLSFASGLSAVAGQPVAWGNTRSRLVGMNTNTSASQSISINRTGTSSDFAACAVVYR